MVRAPPLGEYIDSMFRQLLQGLLHRTPSRCAVCHAWPAQPLCEACVERFAQPVTRCATCALPLAAGTFQCGACVREPPPLDACVAAVGYDYPWSRLIVEFKFHEHAGWAASLAMLMRSAPWVEPALEASDIVIPMPLSPARLRARGFNQALQLARQLAPGKTDAHLLLRIRDTAPQTALGRTGRLANVRHAFAVEPLRASVPVGKRLVLVDDVMTSGASLNAAARVLRAAGAAHVTGLVLARAEMAHGHAG
jgi:ComF family protein